MVQLTPALEKFVLHWGEMGNRWGINRTLAQVHALLFVAVEPLTAEDIAQTLSIARSNVSTAVKELQTWRLIRVVHVLGDRRDRFEAIGDVWEMFERILEARKRREVDPAIAILRACLDEDASQREKGHGDASRERLEALLELFENASSAFDQLRTWPRSTVKRAIKLGGGMRRLLEKIS